MDQVKGEAYINEVIKKVKDTIGISDFESESLKDVVRLLNKPLPTTKSLAQQRLSEIDSCRTFLVNIIFMISTRLAEETDKYKKLYDPEFVRLTRMGRPNQVAVDSEIHLNPDMANRRKIINNYDVVKNLLYGYL